MNQLFEAVPTGAELYWHLFCGLLSAFLVERLLKIMQTMRRIPALVIPRIKALDLNSPVVFFTLQLLAVLIGLGIYTALEAL
ncbi:hypothetical protein [Streptomyces sp. NPDC088766]|uniref:hypothetical protein n=1 Tax=Streptomyces sp. NPDC088766 TaxID=3365893 RepID=UPI00381FB366